MTPSPEVAPIAAPEQRESGPVLARRQKPKYPGIRVTCNGNQLVAQYVESRITEGGVFYPITPSTEGGELYQQSFAGRTDGVGTAEGGSRDRGRARGGEPPLVGHRPAHGEFHLGRGIVYAMEQYYHAGQALDHGLEVGVAR
jgi:pyruvate-ferredoxin/flavodoxin oxidoreductase